MYKSTKLKFSYFILLSLEFQTISAMSFWYLSRSKLIRNKSKYWKTSFEKETVFSFGVGE